MATVSITPIYRSREDKLRAPGKLATTMLEVLAAGSANAARFQRGRAYARDGAIVVLHISPGRLEAEVSGSRSQGYEVTIHTVLAPGPAHEASNTPATLMALVPEADDLRYSCTCPDWEDPCKHAVAALLAFAAEVGERPELLRLWRVGPTERARVGAAKDKPLSVVRRPAAAPPPPLELWQRPEWRDYLGTADGSPVAPDVRELLPPLPGEAPEVVGTVDAAQIVQSARAAIARQIGVLRDLRRR
jgi:hypothetical protein